MSDEIERSTGRLCPTCMENPGTESHWCPYLEVSCECCAHCEIQCEEENS